MEYISPKPWQQTAISLIYVFEKGNFVVMMAIILIIKGWG